MVMAWKDVLLICLIVGALVLGCLARNFVRDVIFVMKHLIAVGATHLPGLLHFVAALVR